ncbi:MAG TPA: hypothetical protein VNO14_08250 [Blastocatellia bacterium]|nr:hypothetical protein [Blastocatellia bacterium]
MSQGKARRGRLNGLRAIAATMILQVAIASAAVTSPSAPIPALDLSSEARTLDGFVNDIISYDRKGRELAKRQELTRAEFASYEQASNDLRRRLIGVQSALGQIVTKLKAAGQWDTLNETLLERVGDPKFQEFIRREDFKKLLAEAASSLSSGANQIAPSDSLRNKVRSQAEGHDLNPRPSILASRVMRVSHRFAPPVFAKSLRCNLAIFRFGITKGFRISGTPTERSRNAFDCYCQEIGPACAAL